MQTSELEPAVQDLPLSEYPPIPWPILLATVAGLFVYLPLARAAGLVSLDWGARFFVDHPALELLERLAGLALLVHWVVTWPLTAFVFPSKNRVRGQSECLALALFLSGPPLLSLALYLAPVKAPLDALEIFLILFPALLISILWYLRTERQWILTACLSVTLFIPLFLMGDLLGPIPVLISYASRGPSLYWWRVALPMVVLAASLSLPTSRYFQFQAWRREVGMTLLGLFILTFVLKVLIPVAVAVREGLPVSSYFELDAGLVLYPLLVACAAGRPRLLLRQLFLAGLVAELAWCLYSTIRAVAGGSVEYWSLSSFGLGLFAAACLVAILIQALRPTVRQFYLA